LAVSVSSQSLNATRDGLFWSFCDFVFYISVKFGEILRLARSHRRFTEEQKVKVFRSLIKETRITANGVELEMYVKPTQNVWWKYRQKTPSNSKARPAVESLRIHIPVLPLAMRRQAGVR
jgi:hypothetical protein